MSFRGAGRQSVTAGPSYRASSPAYIPSRNFKMSNYSFWTLGMGVRLPADRANDLLSYRPLISTFRKTHLQWHLFVSVGADVWLKCDTTPIGFVHVQNGKKKRFSVQSSSVVTRQSIWEMKTCTPVTCCVQCFLESHYFWINLCWWQFHCLLLLLLL